MSTILTYQPLRDNLWRKWKRRYWKGFSAWYLLLLAALLRIPEICLLIWLYHGQSAGWAVSLMRDLWVVSALLQFLLGSFVSLSLSSTKAQQALPSDRLQQMRMARESTLLMACGSGLELIALLVGRIDWAVFVHVCSATSLSIVQAKFKRSWIALLPTIPYVVVIVAVLRNSFWTAVIALGLCAVIGRLLGRIGTGFWSIVQHKPSREAFVRDGRGQCETGHG
jgi:hypothetical protein